MNCGHSPLNIPLSFDTDLAILAFNFHEGASEVHTRVSTSMQVADVFLPISEARCIYVLTAMISPLPMLLYQL